MNGWPGAYLFCAAVALLNGALQIYRWHDGASRFHLVMGILLIATVPIWALHRKRALKQAALQSAR